MKIPVDWERIEELGIEVIVDSGGRYSPDGLAAELIRPIVEGATAERDTHAQPQDAGRPDPRLVSC